MPRHRKKKRTQAEEDAVPIVTTLQHCPISVNATVIAARREKVDLLNECHIEQVARTGTKIFTAEAVDRRRSGATITDTRVISAINKRARSQL